MTRPTPRADPGPALNLPLTDRTIRDVAARALWNPVHVTPAEVQALAGAVLTYLRRSSDSAAGANTVRPAASPWSTGPDVR